MPTTPTFALPYPQPNNTPDVPYDLQRLAEVTEAAIQTLVTAPSSDATFPKAASGVTAATDLDQYTITAVPYARKIAVDAHVYTTVSVAGTQVDLRLLVDATVISTARNTNESTNPQTHFITGSYTLPANTAGVLKLQVQRNSGTGTISTSISVALTNTNVQMVRV